MAWSEIERMLRAVNWLGVDQIMIPKKSSVIIYPHVIAMQTCITMGGGGGGVNNPLKILI